MRFSAAMTGKRIADRRKAITTGTSFKERRTSSFPSVIENPDHELMRRNRCYTRFYSIPSLRNCKRPQKLYEKGEFELDNGSFWSILGKHRKMVVVAQLVRAPGCGPGGRRFESGLPPHLAAG